MSAVIIEKPGQAVAPATIGHVPSGWKMTVLGEVVESMKNGIYKAREAYCEDGIACLRMYNIEAGQVVWKDIKRMRLTKEEVREYGLLPGDLLVNRVNSRELVGKAAAIRPGLEECVFESKNIRVRLKTNLADPRFVSFALQANGQSHFTRNAQQVVGMASISQPQVAAFPLPLPPLDEQQRIVAEIEKQFTRLEAGVASLKRVQAALKRYRASVLKAACEGRLVPKEAELSRRESRTYEPASILLTRIVQERAEGAANRKLKSPAILEERRLPSLPEGWAWASLDQLSHLITKGSSPNWQGFEYCDTGIVFVRSENVRWGSLDLTGVAHLSPAFNQKEKKSVLREGDVLLNLVGASIGRAALASSKVHGGNTNQAVALIRTVLKEPLNKFAVFWLNSSEAQKRIHAEKVDVARANFSLEDARVLPFPLPPLAEQQRIVAEVERRLSVTEELEAVVVANVQRAVRLRQSILQRAFSGKLALESPTT